MIPRIHSPSSMGFGRSEVVIIHPDDFPLPEGLPKQPTSPPQTSRAAASVVALSSSALPGEICGTHWPTLGADLKPKKV